MLPRPLFLTVTLAVVAVTNGKPLDGDVEPHWLSQLPPPPPVDVVQKACSEEAGEVSAAFLRAWQRVAEQKRGRRAGSCIRGILVPTAAAMTGVTLSDSRATRLLRAHLVTDSPSALRRANPDGSVSVGGRVVLPCLDDADGDPDDDCQMALYVVDALLWAEGDDDDPTSSIHFPVFELPTLTEEAEQIMRDELGGDAFVDVWRRVEQHPRTKVISTDNFMALVPSDAALSSAVDGHASALSSNVGLQRAILAGHVVTAEGAIPKKTFSALPSRVEVEKNDLSGSPLVFMKDDDQVLRVNGLALTDPFYAGRAALLGVRDDQMVAQLDSHISEPFEKAGSDKDASSSGNALLNLATLEHFKSAFVPPLSARTAFALRRMGAGRFADIWLATKKLAQEETASLEDDPCLLPRDSGPCNDQKAAKFFYNADLDICQPFVYGGCEGNDNRFDNVLECSRSCVKSSSQQELVRQAVCQMPVYQYQVLEPDLSSAAVPRSSSSLSCEPSVRFHFDVSQGRCEQVEYSGCFGTANLFQTEEECKQLCHDDLAETPDIDLRIDSPNGDDDICSLPPYLEDAFPCRAHKAMWTFNVSVGECVGFFYNGCGASENVFLTEEKCRTRCGDNDGSASPSAAPRRLHIFAPVDAALDALQDSTGDGGGGLLAAGSPLARHLVLSSLTEEDCPEGDPLATVATKQPHFRLKCADIFDEGVVRRDAFDGGSFVIHISSRVLGITDEDVEKIQDNEAITTGQFRTKPSSTKAADENDPSDFVSTAALPAMSDAVRKDLREMGFVAFESAWDRASEDTAPLQELTGAAEICSVRVDETRCSDDGSSFRFDPSSGFCVPSTCPEGIGLFATYDECVEICGEFSGHVATVELVSGADPGSVVGRLVLSQASHLSPVIVRGRVSGLTPGKHGFHIHTVGDVSDGCRAAGGHFNPFDAAHGAKEGAKGARHVGDLGNIVADAAGVAEVDLEDPLASLFAGEAGVVGRAFVVHAGEDDLGRGGDEGSAKTGNAGARAACGVIRAEETVKTFKVSGEDEGFSISQKGPLAPVRVKGSVASGQNLLVRKAALMRDRGSCSLPEQFVQGTFAGDNVDLQLHDANLFPTDPAASADGLRMVLSGPDGDVCESLEEEVVVRRAEVRLRGPGGVEGTLKLQQRGAGAPVKVEGFMAGLSGGKHGFHVHQKGRLGNGCKDAGGHYNPLQFGHSSPDASSRHVGDLGNIIAVEGKDTQISVEDDHLSQFGPHSIVGRAFVVHAGEDDLGQGGDAGSIKTGNAGGRVACGVVQQLDEERGSLEVRRAHVSLPDGVLARFYQFGPRGHLEMDVDELHEDDDGAGLAFATVGDCGEEFDRELGADISHFEGLFGEASVVGKVRVAVWSDKKFYGCGPMQQSEEELPYACVSNEGECGGDSENGHGWFFDSSTRKCLHSLRDGCTTASSPSWFPTEEKCRNTCPFRDENLLILPPTTVSGVEALRKAQTKSTARVLVLGSIARQRYEKHSTTTTVTTMSGNQAELKTSASGMTSDLAERFSTSHTILALVGWPTRQWPEDVISPGEEGDLLKLLVALPARDPAIIRLAARANVTTIFHVWDDFIQPWKENAVSADKSQTIVTVEDPVFEAMDGFPFSRFNGHFLGYQILSKRVAPGDEMKEGLEASTVAGRKLTFKFNEDTLEIEGVPVRAIITTSNSVLYVTERLILG